MSSVECSINPAGGEFWLLLIAILALAALCDWILARRNAQGERIVAELQDHSVILEGLLAQLDKRKAEVEVLDRRK